MKYHILSSTFIACLVTHAFIPKVFSFKSLNKTKICVLKTDKFLILENRS